MIDKYKYKYKARLTCLVYKDAKWTAPGEWREDNGEAYAPDSRSAKFRNSIYYEPQASYERCGAYVVNRLEPAYT